MEGSYLYDYGPQSFDQGKSLYLQITTAKGLTYIRCTTSLIITMGLKNLSTELEQKHEMHASVEFSSRIVCEMFKKMTIPHEEITKNTSQLDEQAVNVEKIAYMDK